MEAENIHISAAAAATLGPNNSEEGNLLDHEDTSQQTTAQIIRGVARPAFDTFDNLVNIAGVITLSLLILFAIANPSLLGLLNYLTIAFFGPKVFLRTAEVLLNVDSSVTDKNKSKAEKAIDVIINAGLLLLNLASLAIGFTVALASIGVIATVAAGTMAILSAVAPGLAAIACALTTLAIGKNFYHLCRQYQKNNDSLSEKTSQLQKRESELLKVERSEATNPKLSEVKEERKATLLKEIAQLNNEITKLKAEQKDTKFKMVITGGFIVSVVLATIGLGLMAAAPFAPPLLIPAAAILIPSLILAVGLVFTNYYLKPDYQAEVKEELQEKKLPEKTRIFEGEKYQLLSTDENSLQEQDVQAESRGNRKSTDAHLMQLFDQVKPAINEFDVSLIQHEQRQERVLEKSSASTSGNFVDDISSHTKKVYTDDDTSTMFAHHVSSHDEKVEQTRPHVTLQRAVEEDSKRGVEGDSNSVGVSHGNYAA